MIKKRNSNRNSKNKIISMMIWGSLSEENLWQYHLKAESLPSNQSLLCHIGTIATQRQHDDDDDDKEEKSQMWRAQKNKILTMRITKRRSSISPQGRDPSFKPIFAWKKARFRRCGRVWGQNLDLTKFIIVLTQVVLLPGTGAGKNLYPTETIFGKNTFQVLLLTLII